MKDSWLKRATSEKKKSGSGINQPEPDDALLSDPDPTHPGLDRELVDRLKSGQAWAFRLLVRTYQERLLKIAFAITLNREDSLEVVQDVFTSVFQNVRNFRGESSLYTWLRKITIRHCLNWKRKWKRRFRWHHDPLESYGPADDTVQIVHDPESLLREKQLGDHLMTAIQTLPEKYRIVFVLNALEGLSYEEIAQTLGIRKGTVSSRLHAARQKLLDALDI